jgi:hypothetical protein
MVPDAGPIVLIAPGSSRASPAGNMDALPPRPAFRSGERLVTVRPFGHLGGVVHITWRSDQGFPPAASVKVFAAHPSVTPGQVLPVAQP